MNRLGIALLVLGVLGGCSPWPEWVDTSGSYPVLGATTPIPAEAGDGEADTGRLLVFSPRMPEENPIDFETPPVTQHTGYTVYSNDGRIVVHEENHGVRMEGPVERKLAPGRYFIRLDHPALDREFWVTIEKGRVTRVQNKLWIGDPELQAPARTRMHRYPAWP